MKARNDAIQLDLAKQMEHIRYVIHSRNSATAYLDPERAGEIHPEVMRVRKAKNNNSKITL